MAENLEYVQKGFRILHPLMAAYIAQEIEPVASQRDALFKTLLVCCRTILDRLRLIVFVSFGVQLFQQLNNTLIRRQPVQGVQNNSLVQKWVEC